MEETAQRRLLSISRHLLPIEPTTSDHIRPSPVSAEDCCCCPVVIGGMVLDIHAKPHASTRPGTTTPGKVRYVRGGVARNVAECMTKLGTKPFMISVVGNDMAGNVLLEHWKSMELTTEGILKPENITTPVVSNIFDVDGEVAAGVASIEAVENCLTDKWIEQFRCNIRSAPILMVDANLHLKSLEVACRIAAESCVPVWFEPVSVTKSRRVADIVKYITCVSPNVDELIAMANALSSGHLLDTYQRVEKNGERRSIETSLQLLRPAINLLLDKGIKFVVLTIGSDGVLLCSRQNPNFVKKIVKNYTSNHFGNQLYQLLSDRCASKRFISSLNSGQDCFRPYALHFPSLPASVVSLTGAGDCLVGGVLASICSGLDIAQSMAVAVSAAKAAVETEANVPSDFFVAKTAAEAKQVFAAARIFYLDG